MGRCRHQLPVIRTYTGPDREATQEAYRRDARQARATGWVPVAHRWRVDGDAHELAVVFEFHAVPAGGGGRRDRGSPRRPTRLATLAEADTEPEEAQAPPVASDATPSDATATGPTDEARQPIRCDGRPARHRRGGPRQRGEGTRPSRHRDHRPPLRAASRSASSAPATRRCRSRPSSSAGAGSASTPTAVRAGADVRAARPSRHVRRGAAAAATGRRRHRRAVHAQRGLQHDVRPRHHRAHHGALEEGLYPATSPETTIRWETPAGLVTATATSTAAREDGHVEVRGVRFVNVPAYLHAARPRWSRPTAALAATRPSAAARVHLAFGGAYYGIVDAADLGCASCPGRSRRSRAPAPPSPRCCARDHTPAHPTDPDLGFVYGTIIVDSDPATSPDGRAADATMRNVTVFADAEVDRSPCGSGTSALLAGCTRPGRLAIGDGSSTPASPGVASGPRRGRHHGWATTRRSSRASRARAS